MRFLAVLTALVLAAGCKPGAESGPGYAPGGGPPAAASAATPVVIVVPVVSKELDREIRVTGELQAWRQVPLYPKVGGFVREIAVDRGSIVKAGDPLVLLDAPELAARRSEAEARLASAEATHKRLKDASATPGVVAGNDLEVAARTVEAEKARVECCRDEESYLRIAAPFAGTITERNVHEGAYVGPPGASGGVPLLRLQELSRLRLVAALPEAAAGVIRDGEEVSFAVPAYPAEAFKGKVARPARSLDPRTRTMPVEVDVDNAAGRLAPGMYAEVRWRMRRPGPSLFVPPGAVATTTERSFLVRVRDGKAEWVDVSVGTSSGALVEVFGDVRAGDRVALRASDETRPGTAVEAREEKAK